MKGSLISLVLTALIVTLFFQPHQHISAASQNNTSEGSNGCLGLHCLIAVDDEANFFKDQLAAGGGLLSASQAVRIRNKPACKINRPGGYSTSCTRSPQFLSVDCEPKNRERGTPYGCRRTHIS